MISNFDVIQYLEKHPSDWVYRKETRDVFDTKLNRVACTIDELTQKLRVANHCDFESIYYCHATLEDVIRCRECGTVIFHTEDEFGYDPLLRCPNCGGYHTSLTYWTPKDMEDDPNKKKIVDFYIEAQREQDEAYARREKRNGLYDWEIAKKKFKCKKFMIELDLECSNLFRTGLKGLNLEIRYLKRDNSNDSWFTCVWHKRIPLSPYAVYIQWIYPYSKKCHKDLRKYHFWQKKPMETESKGV